MSASIKQTLIEASADYQELIQLRKDNAALKDLIRKWIPVLEEMRELLFVASHGSNSRKLGNVIAAAKRVVGI